MIKHDSGDLMVYLAMFIGIAILIGIVIFVIGMFIVAIGSVVGIAGAGYGGGVSCFNYGKSFKENVVDGIKNYKNI